MGSDELEFVAWLRERSGGAGVPVGLGDDMAVVAASGGHILFSSDMLLDGVHFDSREHPFDAIGRKAVNCALSDCAAMAACPKAVTVSLALPEEMDAAGTKALMDGAFAAAGVFDVSVCGGDTTRWFSPLAIDVAVVAVPYDDVTPVLRCGARVGDVLVVTGKLGGSILGRHLSFVPRVREAKALAQGLGGALHAMIDITDGLSLDLWRVCEASGVGALLRTPQLEQAISDDAKTLAETDGRSARDHALCDGEDFELLLSVASDAATQARLAEIGGALIPVGVVTPEGFRLEQPDGSVAALSPKGYVH